MNWAAIIWLLLIVVFLIAEAATVTITSLWFAAGALVALLAGVFGAKFWLQVVLFIIVSTATLLALRPMIKKYFTPNLTRTNVDALICAQGYVTADINNVAAIGAVKINGMEWTARSTDGSSIPTGTLIKVDRIEGVKAIVSPVEIPAEIM